MFNILIALVGLVTGLACIQMGILGDDVPLVTAGLVCLVLAKLFTDSGKEGE